MCKDKYPGCAPADGGLCSPCVGLSPTPRVQLSEDPHSLSLSSAAKSRAIAIPVDLDSQVNNLFLKSHNIVQKTALNWRLTARNAARRDSVLAASRDYRNIIERLQVRTRPGRLRSWGQAAQKRVPSDEGTGTHRAGGIDATGTQASAVSGGVLGSGTRFVLLCESQTCAPWAVLGPRATKAPLVAAMAGGLWKLGSFLSLAVDA